MAPSKAMRALSAFVALLNIALAVAYPLAVFWALTHTSARATGLIALSVLIPGLALRLRGRSREERWAILRVPLVILLVLLAGVLTDDARFVFLMPALINLGLLLTFGLTLRRGPETVPMIERFARMQDPELSAAQVAHCRRWTIRWCVFFALNALAAFALALVASARVWAIYTGGVAYALMALMFAAEFLERRYRFREYSRFPPDRWLARLWPPRATASPIRPDEEPEPELSR